MTRFLDLLISGLALLLLLTLLIPLTIALRLTGEGKVFFTQKRVGRDGQEFDLYKFATMLENSPNMGTGTVTLKDDPRVLPLGRILRKTKINELPQLLNIFKGDMSIIGPRPQTRRCFDAFPPRSQQAITTMRPGLSGIGSLVFRNEDKMMDGAQDPDHLYDQVIMPYKGALEEWYMPRQSVVHYLVFIGLTIWLVASPGSSILWWLFQDLPEPPDELRSSINCPQGWHSRQG